MPGIRPGRRITAEPIEALQKVVEPIGQKNIAGSQVNPATEDSLKTQADFSHNQTTVGTTAVQLTATSTPCKKGVLAKALSTNGDKVYVGKSGVTTGTGYELTAGETVAIEVDNVNKVYAIAGAAGQVVCWIGV